MAVVCSFFILCLPSIIIIIIIIIIIVVVIHILNNCLFLGSKEFR